MHADASLRVDDGLAVVTVTGEIDLATGDLLALVLTDAAASGVDTVLDLSMVEFMDGIGLRHIESAQRSLAAQGRSLRIRRPPAFVRRLFEAAQRDDLLAG